MAASPQAQACSQAAAAAKHARMKERALAFYRRHDVTGTVERLLNQMYLAEPADVYGYMSDYFSKLAREPVISRLVAMETVDSTGGVALELELFCTVNNEEKLMSSVAVPLAEHEATPPGPTGGGANIKTSPGKGGKGARPVVEPAPNEPKEEAPLIKPCASAVDSVSNLLAASLLGLSPADQRVVDARLESVEAGPAERPHPSALQALSWATALAASSLSHTPLFLHLASVLGPAAGGGFQEKLSLPLPVLAAIAGGCGKLKLKEFYLSPLPGSPLPEQISAVLATHQALGRLLAAKAASPVCVLPDSGAFSPGLDRPEQALELLREAASAAGLELNKHVGVFVDVGAGCIYDEGKGKYEVVGGQWKSSDELIALLSDLLQNYPSILGYVDPLHTQDLEGWQKLGGRLGSQCLLVAGSTLEGLPVKASTSAGGEGGEGSAVSGQVGTYSCSAFSPSPTISATAKRVADLNGHYIMMDAPPAMTLNTVVADLAVALKCRFLRMAAPIGLTSCGLLARLLHIRRELLLRGLDQPTTAHQH